MQRRKILLGAPLALAACAGNWSTDFEAPVTEEATKDWKLALVRVDIPEELTVSNVNSVAPNADIVWHGDPEGNRRDQVAQILHDGVAMGAADLKGTRPVSFSVRLQQFHAVTPAAVAFAPSAVHNIVYYIQAFDAATLEPLTDPVFIKADLDAYTGAAAVVAAQEGQTQKVRIVNHLARVTRGWLNIGEDPRRHFSGLGR